MEQVIIWRKNSKVSAKNECSVNCQVAPYDHWQGCCSVYILGLERIHQVTNTIRIANIGWRIRICIREYTFFSEAIHFIRQCSKFHTVIMLSNFINLIKTIIEMNEFTIFYQHQL